MGCLVGLRHLLTRVPSWKGGASTPKMGGGGGVWYFSIGFLYVPPWF